MKESVVVKSPMRIDLCGGTLDCWPLYLLAGPSTTINLSINIYTEVEIRPSDKIGIFIKDLGYEQEFNSFDELINCPEESLSLIRPLVRYFRPQTPFTLSTKSGFSVGSGLGGSSSLCVSLLKAFCQWQGVQKTTEQIVTLASHLEAEVLQMPTGTQDYFSAIQPGLNIIDYGLEGPQANLYKLDYQPFQDHMSLVFTGQAHHSGINNWQVIQAAINKDQPTLNALKSLAKISQKMRQVILANDWGKLPALFKEETQARIQLSEGFYSPEIKSLEQLSIEGGADGIKICGAGGGGCVFIWSPKDRKKQVEEICQKKGFQVLKVRPVAL